MKYFVKRLTNCFHSLLLYVFELYITCMGAFVDAVKFYLLLHLEVHWKVFHFPSVDKLYDVWRTWGHVQTCSVFTCVKCCQFFRLLWILLTCNQFSPCFKTILRDTNSKFINQKNHWFICLKNVKIKLYSGSLGIWEIVKAVIKSRFQLRGQLLSVCFMSGWTEYVRILDEHQGVVLQHGSWAGGWECTIENWHIYKMSWRVSCYMGS